MIKKRLLRICAISLMVCTIISIAIFIIVGAVDVPTSSPLADWEYIIHPLFDLWLSPEEAASMPPEATPINQLNNGEPLAVGITLIYIVEAFGLVAIVILCSDFMDSMFLGIVSMLGASMLIAKIVAATLANVVFVGPYLRAGAQTLIDGSHRWRVIFAYILLAIERFSSLGWDAEDIIAIFMLSIVVVAITSAVLVDLIYVKKAKTSTTT